MFGGNGIPRHADSNHGNSMALNATERSPLLGGGHQVQQLHTPNSKDSDTTSPGHDGFESWFHLFKVDVEKRILFAGFLITLSFSFTQVP